MFKRKSLLSVIICICILLTACSEAVKEADDNAAAGVSGSAVSGAAMTDITDTTVRPEKLPDKLKAMGYEADDEAADVTFFIKERTEQGYRARVRVDGWGAAYPEWELCLELEDEITEITGAEIGSREGNLYTIQGKLEETIFGDADDEDYLIWFDVVVACPNGAHKPGICYWKSEFDYMPEKGYKLEELKHEIQGRKVRVKLRLTNCSGAKMDRWCLWIATNFDIKSISGAEIFYQYDWDWEYCVCGEAGNRSLEKGESVEITFSGECEKGKPVWNIGEVEVAQFDWGVIEMRYGAKYGKIDKYLVADDVNGVDLFFVFDEKGKDSYTATAELTNVLDETDILPEEEADWEEMLEISDWEICLECEDTIEEIEGAEIIAHEGNVYHIRAADKNKWIPPYGMETFQVKVSCQGEIHHLGKVYLSKVKYRGNRISFRGRQKELDIAEKDLSEASGPRWMTYQSLYGNTTDYDSEDFLTKEEEDAFYKRRKWGKTMGR